MRISDYLQKEELGISAAGTSEGALKGWDSRGRGNVATAAKYGWQYKANLKRAPGWEATQQTRAYTHPSRPGYFLTVEKKGGWELAHEDGSSIANSTTAKGSLDDHLNYFHSQDAQEDAMSKARKVR